MQMRVIAQRYQMDCAVACLAMLVGVSYEESLLSFDHMVHREGASIARIKAAAKRLGHPLKWARRVVNLEEETGMLCINPKGDRSWHMVILWSGHIVDTDYTIWETDVYLKTNPARVVGILTLVEGK